MAHIGLVEGLRKAKMHLMGRFSPWTYERTPTDVHH
jgi:hypothetical protein